MRTSFPRRSPFIAAALGLALLAGCSSGRGSMVPGGYQQTRYGFMVRSEGASFLGPEWLLDSHYRGRPKSKGIYETEYAIDLRGDGSYDHRETQLTYDLRFRHRRTGAILWLTTFPVSPAAADTKLSVELRELVDGMAGGRFELPRTGPKTVVEEARLATKIVEEEPATLAGHEAYVATIDLASVDQLQLDPNHRWKRMRVVLVRTDFAHHASDYREDLPVRMVVGYASAPSEFDAQSTALERLLGQVIIGGKQGFLRLRAGELEAPAPAAGAPAATPEGASPPAAAPPAGPPAIAPSVAPTPPVAAPPAAAAPGGSSEHSTAVP